MRETSFLKIRQPGSHRAGFKSPSADFKAKVFTFYRPVDASNLHNYLVSFSDKETETLKRKAECPVVAQLVGDRIESPQSVQS